MEYFEILGIIVCEMRKEKKMSRKTLAMETGYSSTQIGRLERGKIKNPAYKKNRTNNNFFSYSRADN